MMETVGRILVRKGKTAGLFLPVCSSENKMKNGIWEIREIFGELTLQYIGHPKMNDKRYQAISLNELIPSYSAGESSMTKKEWLQYHNIRN